MYKDDSKFPKRKSKTITYFAYGLIALLILFFIFKVEQTTKKRASKGSLF